MGLDVSTPALLAEGEAQTAPQPDGLSSFVSTGRMRVRRPSHRWIGYDQTKNPVTHAARCSCGWISGAMVAPGLAASLWDGHKANKTRTATAEAGHRH